MLYSLKITKSKPIKLGIDLNKIVYHYYKQPHASYTNFIDLICGSAPFSNNH